MGESNIEIPREAKEEIDEKRERLEYLAKHGKPELRKMVRKVLEASDNDRGDGG